MKLEEFKHLIEKYNIPDDCELLSDSGWECDSTIIDGWIYLPLTNVLIGYQKSAPKLIEDIMKADRAKNKGDVFWQFCLPEHLAKDIRDMQGKIVEQDIRVLV